MRTLRLCLAVVVLALGMVLPAHAEDPVEITVLVSQTGPFAFLGKEETESLRALEAAVNRTGGIQGRTLHFAINDVQSNPQVALQIATQAMTRKPAVIMGPELGAAVNAISPITKSDTVLYCYAPSIHPPAGSYVFSSGVSTRDLIFAGMRYLRSKGVRRVGVVATTDTTGQDQLDQVENALRVSENGGMTIAAVERYAISDLNINAQMARIKAAGADALFVGTTGTGFGTALRAAQDVGLAVPVMTNAGNIVRAQMSAYAAFMPKEMYFTGFRFLQHSVARSGPVKDAQTFYLDALRAQGITRPDIGYNMAWDSTAVVVSAYRKFGAKMTAEQLRSYLTSLYGYAGTNGIMDFRDGSQRGVGLNSVVIVRWDPGKDDWVPVSETGGAPLRNR